MRICINFALSTLFASTLLNNDITVEFALIYVLPLVYFQVEMDEVQDTWDADVAIVLHKFLNDFGKEKGDILFIILSQMIEVVQFNDCRPGFLIF